MGTDAVFGEVTFLDTSRHIYKLTLMQKLLRSPPVLHESADSGEMPGAAVSEASSAPQPKAGNAVADQLFASTLTQCEQIFKAFSL